MAYRGGTSTFFAMPMNRPVQYSLRFLLLAILMIASFFGGIAFQKREVNEMRNTVRTQQKTLDELAKQMRAVIMDFANAQKRIRELEARDTPSDGAAEAAQ